VVPLAELAEPDRHPLVARGRRRHVAAEQPIPAAQHARVVALGLALERRVVDAVEVRRHEHEAQCAVPARIHTPVGVGEHRRGHEQRLVDHHGHERRAQGGHDAGSERAREQGLRRMEAQRRREVVVHVGVVHAVEPPEQRHAVEQAVLQVAREVESHERDAHREPSRRVGPVEEPDAALGRQDRRPHRDEGQRRPHDERIDHAEGEVGEPARA